MTVNTLTNEIRYVGNGVTVTFPYDYLVYDVNHMQVFLDGVSQSTGFTVNNTPLTSNGDVTFDAAPATNVQIILLRVVPLTQLIDYQPFDPFPAETHERGLDLGVMRAQQNQNSDTQELRVPITDPQPGEVPTVSVRADKLLGFDENGDPLVSQSDVDDVDALVAAGLGQGSLMSSFSFIGDGTTVAFVIGGVQINHAASILAYIDGISQNPLVDYTVDDDGTDTTVTFTTAPPNLSDVRAHVVGFSKPVFDGEASTTTYLPHDAATGTVPRFVDGRLDEKISVKNFGAVGDGITDDTAAVEAAHAFATAGVAAGTVYFPAGTYFVKLTMNIEFVSPGATWMGDSLGDTTILLDTNAAATSNDYFLLFGFNAEVVNLIFEGNNKDKGIGILIQHTLGPTFFAARARITNCLFKNMKTAIQAQKAFGVRLTDVEVHTCIRGITFLPSDAAGFYTTIFFNRIWIHDCEGWGLYVESPIKGAVASFRDIVVEKCATVLDTYQARITGMEPMSINGWYGEGSPTRFGIELVSIHAHVQNVYLNGTGGLNLGTSSNWIDISTMKTTSATDIILGTGAVNLKLTIRNSVLAGVNSGIVAHYFRIENTLIDLGAGSQLYTSHLAGTQEGGSWTPTIVPGTNLTAVTFTVQRWERRGNVAYVEFKGTADVTAPDVKSNFTFTLPTNAEMFSAASGGVGTGYAPWGVDSSGVALIIDTTGSDRTRMSFLVPVESNKLAGAGQTIAGSVTYICED